SQKDFTYLIKAFEVIKRFDAADYLKEHPYSYLPTNTSTLITPYHRPPSLVDELICVYAEDDKIPFGRCSKWSREAITVAGELAWPTRLSIDSRNNDIYMADISTHRIVKYTSSNPTDSVTILAGLNRVTSIFLDNDDLYIASLNSSYIEKYNIKTKERTIVTRNIKIGKCYGLALDHCKNLYVSDFENHVIWKFPQGIVVAGIRGKPGHTANRLQGPRGIYVTDNSELYVVDSINQRVQKFLNKSTSGTNALTIVSSSSLDTSDSILVDRDGTVYVSEVMNNRIQKWTVNAKAGITVVGGPIAGNGRDQLNEPHGILFDSKTGDLLVVDQKNNRIQKFIHQQNQCSKQSLFL
ncbi:unnamed protein product, partial [Didymodactylos carnosus]